MRLILIIIMLTFFFQTHVYAESDINSFDGYSWGSKQSIVKGKVKEKMNGRIVAIRVSLKTQTRFIRALIDHKIYYFSKDFGLCAGKLILCSGTGASDYTQETLLQLLRAAIGVKYGLINSVNRVSPSQWVTPKGLISIKRSSHKHIIVEYKSRKFIGVQAEYEKETASKLYEKGYIKGFKL